MTPLAEEAQKLSASEQLDRLIAARLIAPERQEVLLEAFQEADLADTHTAMLQFLVTRRELTTFQAERIELGQLAKLVLGPYVLLDMIGSGSLGQVYESLRSGQRGRFALKQLPLRNMWNVIQAKRQVVAFQNLPAHTAIVPFVDIDTAGGVHYLVWPLVQGENFEQLIRRQGPLTLDYAVKWCIEILQALQICHQQGIVHGLLKPANLLLSKNRKVKILDFGIGAILSENLSDEESMLDTISTSNTALSTIDCTPPETFANPTVRTAAGDLYSLGCVLYYWLTGQYPFPEGNVVDKMLAHQMHQPPRLNERDPRLGAGISEFALQLLAKQPQDRPTDYAAMIETLRNIAPNSGKLTEDDIPAPHTQLLSSLLSAETPTSPSRHGAVAELELPKSYRAETDDSINFNISGLPVLDPAAAPGRGPNAQDSAAINYFDEAALLEEELVPLPLPPVVPGNRQTTRGEVEEIHPSVGSIQGRPIVLPCQFQPKTRLKAGLEAAAEVRRRSMAELPNAIQWTATPDGLDSVEFTLPPVVVPPPPDLGQSFGHKLWEALCFWRPAADLIQFSIYGPTHLMPGQRYQFQVCPHLPEAFSSVRTLCRATQSDAELRASDFAPKLIRRTTELGLHLAVANAGLSQSLLRFQWHGQSKAWKFEVFVPWESQVGRSPAMLSVGIGEEVVTQIPFYVMILSRTC